jgi:hypothetical protein
MRRATRSKMRCCVVVVVVSNATLEKLGCDEVRSNVLRRDRSLELGCEGKKMT